MAPKHLGPGPKIVPYQDQMGHFTGMTSFWYRTGSKIIIDRFQTLTQRVNHFKYSEFSLPIPNKTQPINGKGRYLLFCRCRLKRHHDCCGAKLVESNPCWLWNWKAKIPLLEWIKGNVMIVCPSSCYCYCRCRWLMWVWLPTSHQSWRHGTRESPSSWLIGIEFFSRGGDGGILKRNKLHDNPIIFSSITSSRDLLVFVSNIPHNK